MTETSLEHYFRRQQVSPQWQDALRAMADALGQYADEAQLRALFGDVGAAMAALAREAMAQTNTLAELQSELNDYWLPRQWGWVELAERSGSIEIDHHAAPLAEAFGEPALSWSCGLLEGFYQGIFQALGATDGACVTAIESDHRGLLLRLRFGH